MAQSSPARQRAPGQHLPIVRARPGPDAIRPDVVPPPPAPPRPVRRPAERLFEEVRRHVEGRVYATLADKVAAVAAFLEQLDADPARVRRLCGWDWITAAITTLPKPLENAA